MLDNGSASRGEISKASYHDKSSAQQMTINASEPEQAAPASGLAINQLSRDGSEENAQEGATGEESGPPSQTSPVRTEETRYPTILGALDRHRPRASAAVTADGSAALDHTIASTVAALDVPSVDVRGERERVSWVDTDRRPGAIAIRGVAYESSSSYGAGTDTLSSLGAPEEEAPLVTAALVTAEAELADERRLQTLEDEVQEIRLEMCRAETMRQSVDMSAGAPVGRSRRGWIRRLLSVFGRVICRRKISSHSP